MAAPTVDGDTPRRIVVVGGGPAGARTCEQLRRRGFEGELTLVAAKSYPPYDRPPLSKDVLLGDALRLRARLTPGARVVVVGASWIGAEVAKRVASWWSGVDLRTDVAVDHVEKGSVVLRDVQIGYLR